MKLRCVIFGKIYTLKKNRMVKVGFGVFASGGRTQRGDRACDVPFFSQDPNLIFDSGFVGVHNIMKIHK